MIVRLYRCGLRGVRHLCP